MCVKEFLGFTCGHCSVPYLRQCPLTTSQPHFPPCSFPAERPIFTGENCSACSRVVWNIHILEQEEIHRSQHKRGECECEVIFDEEERQRRTHQRTRPSKGKGKGKSNIANGGEEDMQIARIGESDDVVLVEGSETDEETNVQSEYGQSQSDNHFNDNVPSQHTGASSTQQFSPATTNFGDREYVGYTTGGSLSGTDSRFIFPAASDMGRVERQHGFPQGGIATHVWAKHQSHINQPDGGMIWHPHANVILPPVPDLAALAAHRSAYSHHYPSRNWERTTSEPTERAIHSQYPSPAVTVVEGTSEFRMEYSGSDFYPESHHESEPQQPLVVSSDMAFTKTN